MNEKQLLDYLISQAKKSGVNTNSREFKEKVLRAKEYIAKRQDYLQQQENIKKTAELLSAEIANIKIESPTVNIPEIKIPEIKIPDITGLEELKKELQKDLTVKGIEDIEQDLLGILSVTEKIMQSFDKPIPVVLVSPSGKEYEAQGGGGGGANTSALAKEKTLSTVSDDLDTIKDEVADLKTAIITNKPFNGYGLYAVDSNDATYMYVMYQNTEDKWIILRIVLATGVTTYAKGTITTDVWTNRATQTYDTYEVIFG